MTDSVTDSSNIDTNPKTLGMDLQTSATDFMKWKQHAKPLKAVGEFLLKCVGMTAAIVFITLAFQVWTDDRSRDFGDHVKDLKGALLIVRNIDRQLRIYEQAITAHTKSSDPSYASVRQAYPLADVRQQLVGFLRDVWQIQHIVDDSEQMKRFLSVSERQVFDQTSLNIRAQTKLVGRSIENTLRCMGTLNCKNAVNLREIDTLIISLKRLRAMQPINILQYYISESAKTTPALTRQSSVEAGPIMVLHMPKPPSHCGVPLDINPVPERHARRWYFSRS